MRTIAVLVLFAAGLAGCAADPSTSETAQDTFGICTSVPVAPGDPPQSQCTPAWLPQATIDYATEIAVGYGYLGPVSTACAGSCTTVIGIGGGNWLNCTCSASLCDAYVCPGDVFSAACTQID